VVLVSREGDPAAAVSVAVTTAGLETEDDAEPATALAGVVEARLTARGLLPAVTPSWSGLRATLLVAREGGAAAAASLREVLVAGVDAKDLAAAKRKLAALGARPLRDAALGRWARCVGSPYAQPARAGRAGEDLTLARLEGWRAAAHGLGRVAIGVAGSLAVGDAVASEIARGPAWSAGAAPPSPDAAAREPSARVEVDVFETGESASGASPSVYATLDVTSASGAVGVAEALGDPHGALGLRLATLELPFRLREATGTADARGGCVGVVLEAAPRAETATASGRASEYTSRVAAASNDLAARVADAVALVHAEARVYLDDGGARLDGRTLARRAGDPREAAQRAAWWGLADAWSASASPRAARLSRGSMALRLPPRRGQAPASGADKDKVPSLEPSREALAAAMQRATLAWDRPVVEGRVKVEPGQGEAWVLLASPCGTDAESDVDAGLTALFATGAAEMARTSPEVKVEPWVVPDGVGLLVHGPALAGESPASHARRLADVGARSLASEPLLPSSLSRARADILAESRSPSAPALAALATAIAPGHASWVLASGREDAIARSADAAVVTRAQALRGGPWRVAVLANESAAQGEAAVRAADRWVDRRARDDAQKPAAARDAAETRTCRGATTASPPRAGTYAVEPRPGASPEAYLAFPLPPGDDVARAPAAAILIAALDGAGGLLERGLGGAGLASSWSARVLGAPRAPALVIRVASAQASLDGAVMQVRALLDRLRKGDLPAADLERAVAAAARSELDAALDPRSRVVAAWRQPARGADARAAAPPRATAEEVRAFAGKHLGEEGLVVVASRPGRPRAP